MGWQDAPLATAAPGPAWAAAPEARKKLEVIDPGVRSAASDSGMDNFMAGVGKAIYDTGRGAGQLLGLVRNEDVKESRRLDKDLMDTGAGVGGNIAGNIGIALLPGGALKAAGTAAGSIPAAARVAEALNVAGNTMLAPKSIKAAAAVGSGLGALQPAESAQERVTNAILGGAISAGANAVPKAVSRVLNPQTSPEAATLMKEGVTLTPGQIMGGTAQRVEDGATSLPVIGDAIKAAQRRGIESFDEAAINRTLAPISQKLPKGLKGYEAVAYAQEALGDAYEALLPKLKGALDNAAPANALPAKAGQAATPTLREELDVIRQMGANLPEAQAGQLNRIIENEVVKRFTPAGIASGETLKNIESKLGGMAKDFARSENYDVRTMGDAVQEVQAALRRMVENVNPGYGKELSAVNSGWANFKRVQKAAASVGAKEGVFTPAQLQSAVKAADKSKDKARFAVGEAMMQDLSGAGKSVMSSTVPDSGTPFRLANLATMGGGYLLDPMVAGGAITGAAAYTDPVLKVTQALLAQRPEIVRQFGPKVAATAPYLSIPAFGVQAGQQ